MSTQAMIAVKQLDGSWNSIYLHWDGYASAAGKTLLEHYGTHERAQQLIELGNLSELAPSLEPTGFTHGFDQPEKGVCVAYARDRGEDLCSNTYANLTSMVHNCLYGEYIYLMNEGVWYTYAPGEQMKMLADVVFGLAED
jgi:hypothetical protein